MSKFIKLSFIILIINGLLGILFFVPVPEKHYSITDYYAQTFENIQKTKFLPTQDSILEAGFARENLMFSKPLNLAGYGFRGNYESVHDSLKINVLYLKNATQNVIIISLDLLIFPPEVVANLERELPNIGENTAQVFFTATHTHTATGGWAKPPLGWLFGRYDEKVTDLMTQQIIKAIRLARQKLEQVSIGFQKIQASEYVRNRLSKNAQVDDFVRVICFRKANGKSIVWATFSAHPTCVSATEKTVSRDYPGILTDKLEANTDIDFAIFSAGAVGSHAPKSPQNLQNFDKIEEIGSELSQKILNTTIYWQNTVKLNLTKIPLKVGDLSPRISEKWRLRPRIFREFLEEQNLNLSVLRLGNQLICGVPADFSGELMTELDKIAQKKDINLMITSFNGAYIGYILPQKRLQIGRDETREMNWLNNYAGEYFVELISQIMMNQKKNKTLIIN